MPPRSVTIASVSARSDQETADLIIGEVLRVIESEGYHAVEMTGVARQTHRSLETIYRLFPSREDLIVAAVETWMAGNSWSDLTGPREGESVYDTAMRILRKVFEPWERNPRALEAYYRALESPKGRGLQTQNSAFGSVFRALMGDDNSVYIDDLELVLMDVVFGTIAAFVKGELDIMAVLPRLERAVFRLTTNNEPDAEQTAARWSSVGLAAEGATVAIPGAAG